MKLDDIRDAVEAKYKGLEIDLKDRTVELRNLLRLPEDRRAQFRAIQAEAKEEGANTLDCMKRLVATLIERKADADALLKAVGDDLAVYAEIVEEYGKGTQVGEASGSQS